MHRGLLAGCFWHRRLPAAALSRQLRPRRRLCAELFRGGAASLCRVSLLNGWTGCRCEPADNCRCVTAALACCQLGPAAGDCCRRTAGRPVGPCYLLCHPLLMEPMMLRFALRRRMDPLQAGPLVSIAIGLDLLTTG